MKREYSKFVKPNLNPTICQVLTAIIVIWKIQIGCLLYFKNHAFRKFNSKQDVLRRIKTKQDNDKCEDKFSLSINYWAIFLILQYSTAVRLMRVLLELSFEYRGCILHYITNREPRVLNYCNIFNINEDAASFLSINTTAVCSVFALLLMRSRFCS